jgi:hypothetical protein
MEPVSNKFLQGKLADRYVRFQLTTTCGNENWTLFEIVRKHPLQAINFR